MHGSQPLSKHRTALTLVRREGERSKVEKIEVSPQELETGIELEGLILSELVKSHNICGECSLIFAQLHFLFIVVFSCFSSCV